MLQCPPLTAEPTPQRPRCETHQPRHRERRGRRGHHDKGSLLNCRRRITKGGLDRDTLCYAEHCNLHVVREPLIVPAQHEENRREWQTLGWSRSKKKQRSTSDFPAGSCSFDGFRQARQAVGRNPIAITKNKIRERVGQILAPTEQTKGGGTSC